jgi:hypothetical protein
MLSYPGDVAGPGLLVALGAGVAGGLLFLVIAVLLEAAMLVLVRWGKFRRALVGALVANLVSFTAGLFAVGFVLYQPVLWLAITFTASVVIEGAVLLLFNRPARWRNWLGSLVANVASYVPIAIVLALLVGGQSGG